MNDQGTTSGSVASTSPVNDAATKSVSEAATESVSVAVIESKSEPAIHDREKVIAAIPAYNEAATIGSVVHSVSSFVDDVVVVDDGSSDATGEIAHKAGATVISHTKNQGKGLSIQRIFEFTRGGNYSKLVLLDGDWQHDPKEIPILLRAQEEQNKDILVGSRYLTEDQTGTPTYRRLGQKFLDVLTGTGNGENVTDSQSGFRVFNREAIESLNLTKRGFGIESEILQLASDNDLEVGEAPISVRYDVPNSNTYNPIQHGLSVVDSIIRVIRDRHPLLFFGVPGLLLTAIGLFYGTWTIYIYKSNGIFYIGKGLFAGILLLLGVLSIFSALIMNMIGNMFKKYGHRKDDV